MKLVGSKFILPSNDAVFTETSITYSRVSLTRYLFRIAATLAGEAKSAGRKLLPRKMHPDDVPANLRRQTTEHTLNRIRYFANAAGWHDLGNEVATAGFTVEQESL